MTQLSLQLLNLEHCNLYAWCSMTDKICDVLTVIYVFSGFDWCMQDDGQIWQVLISDKWLKWTHNYDIVIFTLSLFSLTDKVLFHSKILIVCKKFMWSLSQRIKSQSIMHKWIQYHVAYESKFVWIYYYQCVWLTACVWVWLYFVTVFVSEWVICVCECDCTLSLCVSNFSVCVTASECKLVASTEYIYLYI